MKKTILMLFILVLLGLTLPASDFRSEPLYDALYTMDYGPYSQKSEFKLRYNAKEKGTIERASILYGENYVEYLVEGEHTADLFLTEEGALYSYDGEILNVTKPNEKNLIFASYMEILSTLLQEHYEDFLLSSLSTFEGNANLEGKNVSWVISLDEEPIYTTVTYRYLFENGKSILLEGTVLTEELTKAETLIGITKLPSFQTMLSK